MVKVYYGADSGYTAHKAEKDLKKDLSEEEYRELIRFDGYKDLTKSVVEDCSSLSLFGEKKHVLFSNCYFLSTSTGRKSPFTDSQQGNYKDLINYLKDPSPDCDLYLLVDGPLKKSGPLYDALQDGDEVYLVSCDLPSDDDYLMLANKVAKEENKEIDPAAAKMLLSRSKVIATQGSFQPKGVDYLTFMNSLEKLLTYTKHVTTEDVMTLVPRPLEDNVFEIVTKLLQKDTKSALHIYHDLRQNGVDVALMIPAFASRFREYALTKYLIEMSESNNKIADELSSVLGRKIKPGAIYYRSQDLKYLSFAKLLQILNDLGVMEMNIRLYQDDGPLTMELFLSDFNNRYYRR